MNSTKQILIIIQRSNGDVFLSSSLIKALYENYEEPQIDLLINDDTISIAELFPFIRNIYTFSYSKKRKARWRQEKDIVLDLYKKYDLSINLTASDRSVIYALIAGKKSISAVEINKSKSWWKKIFLTHYYYFDDTKHILENNLKSLSLLNINYKNIHFEIEASTRTFLNIKSRLDSIMVTNFIIFHPSAQYEYKIYPKKLRDKLLKNLSKLGVPILVTGSSNLIDMEIKKILPSLPNIHDFIGQTSIEEFFALSKLSLGYIGMDTLNMHIAASQNKRIFAIFGPTKLSMWSPWSNTLHKATKSNEPLQSYDNITIFQNSIPCKVCGKVGCGSNHGKNELIYDIDPKEIFNEVEKWFIKIKI